MSKRIIFDPAEYADCQLLDYVFDFIEENDKVSPDEIMREVRKEFNNADWWDIYMKDLVDECEKAIYDKGVEMALDFAKEEGYLIENRRRPINKNTKRL